MEIKDFISNFKNHPILFVGTGISLRYLENSYTWDGLLQYISFELTGNKEYYLDLKSKYCKNSNYQYDLIAKDLENQFNKYLVNDRNGKFKKINDIFYENMEKGINISRFKIYIASLFNEIKLKEEKINEVNELKKIRKNIGSIITTNYDKFIENTFEFNPLIGNDILLSNPYGSVYKIHGCTSSPEKIIITSEDYNNFEQKYELIRAQLLSLFIHNPIIFIGYSITDENIRKLLKTIFTYVPNNSELAKKIKANFLLVEYEPNSTSTNVYEHDINIDETTTIRVNKIKTDNFVEIYKSISSLQLPVSAMDIRKVQNVVKEIYEGGSIAVHITEDIDDLNNDSKVVAIGTLKTIKYEFQTTSEIISNYFNIIDEENIQLLNLVDKQTIQKNQYFPIFAFSNINKNILKSESLKIQQLNKLKDFLKNIPYSCKINYNSIESITEDKNISKSNVINTIIYNILSNSLNLNEIKKFLLEYENKKGTEYRRILCAYDFMRYADKDWINRLTIK